MRCDMSPRWMLFALALMAAPSVLPAQTRKPSSGFDSFLLLVAPRDSMSIKRSLKAAVDAAKLAENRRQQAETMRLGARATIEAKKVEIIRLKEKIGVAKKENREADRVGLEAERKAAEREVDLLKVREELRQAETDLETKRAEFADLNQKALQLELQLSIRRAGRSRAPASGAGAASQDRVIGELEKQTLQAQREQAIAGVELADREIRVIDRRMDLLDAQLRVLSGK